MLDPETKQFQPASLVLEKNGLRPLHLQAKEGLALINGTQFITTFASEACARARNVARTADIVGAITLEALRGSPKAFSACIHAPRPHIGQQIVAARLRTLLHSDDPSGFRSEIYESHKFCSRVQDSYTLRCIPQVFLPFLSFFPLQVSVFLSCLTLRGKKTRTGARRDMGHDQLLQVDDRDRNQQRHRQSDGFRSVSILFLSLSLDFFFS